MVVFACAYATPLLSCAVLSQVDICLAAVNKSRVLALSSPPPHTHTLLESSLHKFLCGVAAVMLGGIVSGSLNLLSFLKTVT